MEVIAYIATACIGISLGLIGGGGSILTMPVLVYLFSISPLLATSYSLFVVGSTSLVGALNSYRKAEVDVKAALVFGSASVITVFLTRKYITPDIPVELFHLAGHPVSSALATMVMFGLLMLAASFSMIRSIPVDSFLEECSDCIQFFKLMGYGILIGIITGLLGAGGGFLLIPALVLVLKLPMKKAVGNSLMIIALNSLVGFIADLGHFTLDWGFLIRISTIAVAGLFVGAKLRARIPAGKLKKGFGWFVLFMGMYVIFREVAK